MEDPLRSPQVLSRLISVSVDHEVLATCLFLHSPFRPLTFRQMSLSLQLEKETQS